MVVFAVGLLTALAPTGGFAFEIAHHRAAYKLELASTRTGSPVVSVSGGMTFEWADACDGWATEQRYLLKLVNADEPERILKTSFVTWESKDGLRYRFNVKRVRTGAPDEIVQGEAVLNADGAGMAKFYLPEKTDIELPAGTKFPTNHILALMKTAEAGGRFQPHFLFDGGALEGSQSVTALLLPPRASRPDPALTDNLANPTVWPMFLAYFKISDKTGEPDFEMSMEMQPNGVVPRMVLDYGDFKLNGVLDKIEPLTSPQC
ncbi:MAG: cell envelope integrity EipB family protein [Rhodospirillaceae bacterium]|nr:cell envelope integrity EipB family protein [Rhodospirillaceae bacterium]MBT5665228.1 cell envelope integrity EipB family protein [Rhodospirillaceae bacterium]MBT5811297.1 cell envelope integrity EipB family protein [Rhodospirillaceae bacterium]